MGMFDHLIPTDGAAPASAPPVTSNMFDHLIPKDGAEPASAPVPEQRKPLEPYTGLIAPVHRDAEGKLSPAVPRVISGIPDFVKGVWDSTKSAATVTRDVMDGKVDPTTEEGHKRVMDLALLGVGAGPGVAAGLAKGTRQAAAAPTTQALKDAGARGFDAARASGAEYSGDAIRGMAQALRVQLENKGIVPENAPGAFAALKKLEAAPPGSVTDYARVKAMRDMFNNASASNVTNLVEGKAGKEAVKMIDDFLTAPPPGAARGSWQEAAQLHKDALGNYAAGMRAETAEKTLGKAEAQTQGAHAGLNFDNTMRQKARDLLGNEKKSAGLNTTERAALQAFIKGSKSRNALRIVSSVLGGGGGMSTVSSGGLGTGAGFAIGGPVGAAIGAVAAPAAGFATRVGQNALSRNQYERWMDDLRRRSPLHMQGATVTGAAPFTVGQSSYWRQKGLISGTDE